MSQQPATITLKERLEDIEMDNNVKLSIQAAEITYPSNRLNKIKYVIVKDAILAHLVAFLNTGKSFTHTQLAQRCLSQLSNRERQHIDGILAKSIQQNMHAAEHHQFLLERISKSMQKKTLEPTRNEVNRTCERLHIDYNKVSYKKGINLTLKKNIYSDKDYISIIEGIGGKEDLTTLICFYQYLPDDKLQARRNSKENSREERPVQPKQSLESLNSNRSVESKSSRSSRQSEIWNRPPTHHSGNIIDKVATAIIQIILLILGLALLIYLLTEVLHNQGIAPHALPERKLVKWFIRGFLMDLPQLDLSPNDSAEL